MKITVFLVFSLLTIFVSITSAQDFRLGLKLESNSPIVNETGTNNTKIIYNAPSGLYVSFLYTPIKKLALEFNIGGDFDAAYFTGNGAGLFARYSISEPLYATGGIVVHDIYNNSNPSIHAYSNTFVIFPALGIGANIDEHLGIEFAFLYANSYRAGYTLQRINIYPEQFHSDDVKLKWIAKLGISYSFGL